MAKETKPKAPKKGKLHPSKPKKGTATKPVIPPAEQNGETA